MQAKKPKSGAIRRLYDRIIGDDPQLLDLFNEYEVKADIAKQVYDLLTQANLTVEQMAERVGVGQSVIEELEQADFEGDSLAMLVKIAAALNQELEIRFVPAPAVDTAELPS